MVRIFGTILVALVLAACQSTNPYHESTTFNYNSNPQTISYVSATPAGDVQTKDVQAYVSAMEQAQAEFVLDEERHGDEILAKLTMQTEETSTPSVTVWGNATQLWGKPPTSGRAGVTLNEESLRTRLNDALSTTPLGGTAKWNSGNLTFMFVPNSPVYTPHHSGGRCRDGVFAIYGDGFTDQCLRGLFCQSGPGANWLLIMQNKSNI